MRPTLSVFVLAAIALAVVGIGIKVTSSTTTTTPTTSTTTSTRSDGPLAPRSAALPARAIDPHVVARSHVLANQGSTPRDDDDLLRRVRAAAKDDSSAAEASIAILMQTLDATEEAADPARLEAIDALVARKHIAALPRIIKMDPVDDPYVGPSIIVALGELGAITTNQSDRTAALERLAFLLRSEKDRKGTDSAGYVVTIIEAIGTLRHPSGAPILEKELFDSFHDVPSLTTIVLALKQIGRHSSIEPITRLRTFRRASVSDPNDDAFASALNRELATAMDDAIRTLEK
jgi:hypothetical protein